LGEKPRDDGDVLTDFCSDFGGQPVLFVISVEEWVSLLRGLVERLGRGDILAFRMC
jgi:hypothetical protein